jgi:hypothetical protein
MKRDRYSMNNTIFKPYTVIDNFLENPYDLINRAESINYFTNEPVPFRNFNLSNQGKPSGVWRGYRSEQLDMIDPALFNKVNDQIIKAVLGIEQFQYMISSFLHKGDESIDCTDLWHKDVNTLFAYILYLNPNPPSNSGTLIKVGDEICPIENRFNRLVFYNSTLEHKVERFFGNSFQTSRLTLTGFVDKFAVSN